MSKAKEIEGLRRELNQLKRRLGDVDGQDQKTQKQKQKQNGKSQLQASGQEYASGLRTDMFDSFEDDGGASWATGRAQKRRNVNGDWNWGLGPTSGDVYESSGSVQNSSMPGYNGFDATLDGTTAGMVFNGFQSIPQMPENELLFSTQSSSIHHNNISTTLHTQLHQHPRTDFWRGKYSILQTIYNIVCDCDEFWVPSIIEIVRTSLSPEEALLAIQRMLLGDQTVPMGVAMHSPESLSSVPVDMGASAFLGGGVDMGFAGIVSPASQSHSSGDG
jgi:hypothetical protein